MALTRGAKNDIDLGRGGSYSVSRDVIKHWLWDTYAIPAAPVSNTFFSQPVGAPFAGGIKTLTETNLTDSGKLPNGQTFLIKKMGIGLSVPINQGDDLAASLVQDFANLIQSVVFEIHVAGREFDYQIPGRAFLPQVFVCGTQDNNTNAEQPSRVGDVITSGFSSLDNTPIYLDQLVSFSVNMRYNQAQAAHGTKISTSCTALNTEYAKLVVMLEGTLTRAK